MENATRTSSITFLRGRLLVMDKKSGCIHPIVVGYVWRHLLAKCASTQAIDNLADYFTSLQLGVGFQEVVRLLSTLLGISFLTFQMTTSFQSLTSLMLSTVSIGKTCWSVLVRSCQCFTCFVIKLTVSMRLYSLVGLLYRHSRVRSTYQISCKYLEYL